MLGAGMITRDILTDASVVFDQENQVARISIDRLRPGEAALVHVDADNDRLPHLEVQMNSPNWESSRAGLASVQPQPLAYVVGLLSVVASAKVADTPPLEGISPWILAVGIIAVGSGVVLLAFRVASFLRRRLLSPTVLEFYWRTNIW
jgi:hypothetical protein